MQNWVSIRQVTPLRKSALIPNAQLAVFPGADHFLIFQSPEKLLPTIQAFLDAPVPEPKKPEGRN
jgi:pimeloyl-ACP methyl ester carboxylesterase